MKQRKVKIVATLGQSTDDKIENIVKNQLVDAVLIDDYYGNSEENCSRITAIKNLNEKYKTNIAVIYDLDHIYSQSKYKLIKIDFSKVEYSLDMNVDFVACPFVSNMEEICKVKQLINNQKEHTGIIVKIDSKEAYDNINEILECADAIMINRDELGMDFDLQDLPIIQKEIIEKANLAGKQVIITTQMLQSMVYNPRPTRAEVSDVANATIDGVDAILLVEETATGYYVEESLETLNRIVCYIDKNFDTDADKRILKNNEMSIAHAMSMSSKYLIEQTKATNIVTYTKSGQTAKFIAKYRPKAAILAIVPNEVIARKLSLTWGIHSYIEPNKLTMEEMIEKAPKFSKENNMANKGDYILVTLGGDSRKNNFVPTDFLTIKEVD
ncbi:pyruvate kinase [Gemella sp. GH3]|uniref:pyruvate kinase n=1 Tax=unclassified Gemella TaxID=2624949 RepID=UPI0015CFB132|nr:MULTISPECIES: pyruvate kinase [unclassified Gemella]MBF0713553.1 pyruvate kinase [Gemella sp. GH3.1]NYS50505.1 pyruvate kinase [Gemella sp. GH3]